MSGSHGSLCSFSRLLMARRLPSGFLSCSFAITLPAQLTLPIDFSRRRNAAFSGVVEVNVWSVSPLSGVRDDLNSTRSAHIQVMAFEIGQDVFVMQSIICCVAVTARLHVGKDFVEIRQIKTLSMCRSSVNLFGVSV